MHYIQISLVVNCLFVYHAHVGSTLPSNVIIIVLGNRFFFIICKEEHMNLVIFVCFDALILFRM